MLSSRPVRALSLCLALAAAPVLFAASPAAAQIATIGRGNPFAAPQASIHYARTRDYHVRHLQLIFDIDGVKHSAQGVVTHYLSPLRDNLQQIVLDAGKNLQIAQCRINSMDVTFTHDGDQLIIKPSGPLPRGKEVAVEIHYTMPGGITGGGANGIGGFHWVEPRAEQPDRKLSFWTQGETNTNHNWVPCYDYPNDKCTSETITTVPQDWIVIGNGTEGKVTTDKAKKTKTFRWTMKQPHSTYLLSLVGGELDVAKASWEGIPLYYVVPRGKADLIPGSFGNTPDMLTFFSNTLGVKYPWPKYAQSAMQDFGGGMENVSATTLGANSLTDKRSGNYPMSSLNSHELGHQWFGDLITCKDWGDIWLNESFATFMEMIYTEHLEGKDSYDRDVDGAINSYLNESRQYKRPLSTKLYANPDVMFDRHTYPKGGAILHMMRREMGDADFFRALGHYLKIHGYEPVDSHDLSQSITEATGKNVEPFFDQWIYKPGHPVLEYSWKYDDAGKAVVLTVNQTQDTSDGTPIYNLPLKVAVLFNNLSAMSPAEGVGIHVGRAQVAFNLDKSQEFRIPCVTKPDALLIDPDHDLLKELKNVTWTPEETAVILRYAPCYLDRRRALGLYADGDLTDAKIQMLTDTLKGETSDYEAANIIQALGNAQKESLRPLFREQAQSKSEERRAFALTALGKLPRNDDDVKLMRRYALSDTEPYSVVQPAMGALGKWDAAGSIDVWKHQIASKSLRDQLANRVISILGDAKLDAGVPLLVEATRATHSVYVRDRAARALASAPAANAEARQALVALLNTDAPPSLQKSAIRSLKERNDKDAAPALRAFAAKATDKSAASDAKDAADNLEGK